jgi:hypothetical protein
MPNGSLSKQLTRREWTAALTATAALAQTPTSQPPNAEAELQAARDQVKANVAALLEVEVSMSTEPAFQFKA